LICNIDAACFLASADASYITGSILNVDGGLTSNFGPSCVSKSDLTGNRYVMTIARS